MFYKRLFSVHLEMFHPFFKRGVGYVKTLKMHSHEVISHFEFDHKRKIMVILKSPRESCPLLLGGLSKLRTVGGS